MYDIAKKLALEAARKEFGLCWYAGARGSGKSFWHLIPCFQIPERMN
jgi:hypothetical protein